MHPSTENLLRWFKYDHLPNGAPRAVSMRCAELAYGMAKALPEGPELSAGLRKLLEAKDCLVRSAITSKES